MVVTRMLRPQPGWRSLQKPLSGLLSLHRQRNLHSVPPLVHGDVMKQYGIPGLLSPEGYDIAWTQYQGLLVNRVNELTAGTVDENTSAKGLTLKYARNPMRANVFNNSSMAVNNHFFFSCLTPQTNPVAIPKILDAQLISDFNSIESLRADLLATANAMFGPGFVWLVKSSDGQAFKILATYLAGTPYPEAHYRAQSTDMNTQNMADYTPGDSAAGSGQEYQRRGAAPRDQTARKRAPGNIGLQPVLCVNTWEHVWLRDWGVGGKKAYLEAWWNKIDWNMVAGNADLGSTGRYRSTL